MKKLVSYTILLFSAALVAGCGADADDESISVSLGYDIKGLRYTSVSYSGETDESGDFMVRNGELVTFSLGGLELATVQARHHLTLADIFSVTLPDTQPSVEAELRSETATPFHRMANVMAFLMLLDNDQDPSGGIDVSAWNNSHLPVIDFDQNLYQFFYFTLAELAQRKNIVRRRFSVSEPLRVIYDGAGIRVRAEAPIESASMPSPYDSLGRRIYTYKTGTPILGLSEFTAELIYADNGRVSGITTGGSVEEFEFQYREYTDSYSRIIQKSSLSTGYYFDLDGISSILRAIFESIFGPINNGNYSYRYDSESGAERVTESRDKNFDGTIDEVAEIRQSYDSVGTMRSRETHIDTNADGEAETRISETYGYAANGVLTEYQYERRLTDSGDVNKTMAKTFVRSNSGKLQSYSENTRYSNGNWNLSEAEFNGKDKIVSKRYTSGQDETIKFTSSYEYQYNQQGNQIGYIHSRDDQGDGIADRTESITRVFSASGQLERLTEIHDTNGDGAPDFHEVIRNIYDARGRLTTSALETDRDGDGVVDFLAEMVSTYGKGNDRITAQKKLFNYGSSLHTQESFYAYNAAGNVISKRYIWDREPDGGLGDSEGEIEYAYQVFENGLGYMVENNIPVTKLGELKEYTVANDFWLHNHHSLAQGVLEYALFKGYYRSIEPGF